MITLSLLKNNVGYKIPNKLCTREFKFPLMLVISLKNSLHLAAMLWASTSYFELLIGLLPTIIDFLGFFMGVSVKSSYSLLTYETQGYLWFLCWQLKWFSFLYILSWQWTEWGDITIKTYRDWYTKWAGVKRANIIGRSYHWNVQIWSFRASRSCCLHRGSRFPRGN